MNETQIYNRLFYSSHMMYNCLYPFFTKLDLLMFSHVNKHLRKLSLNAVQVFGNEYIQHAFYNDKYVSTNKEYFYDNYLSRCNNPLGRCNNPLGRCNNPL